MNQSSNSRKKQKRPAKKGEGLHILLYYVLPFIVVNSVIFFLVTTKPKYEVSIATMPNFQSATITLTVKSILPLKSFSVKFADEPVEFTKEKNKTYTLTVESNGMLEVQLVSINGFQALGFEHVETLDDNPPVINDYDVDKKFLNIQIEDSQSGIDYDSIVSTTTSGKRILPASIDKERNTISFFIEKEDLSISIKDLAGNEALVSFDAKQKELDGSIIDNK